MRDSGMLALAAGLSLSQITSLEVKVGEWSPDDVSRLERGEFFLDLLKRFGEVGELYGPYIQH